jgi:hypothetical protein
MRRPSCRRLEGHVTERCIYYTAHPISTLELWAERFAPSLFLVVGEDDFQLLGVVLAELICPCETAREAAPFRSWNGKS